MDREEQSLHIQHGYEAAREKKIKGLQDKVREQADRIADLEEDLSIAEFDLIVPLNELQEENERLKEWKKRAKDRATEIELLSDRIAELSLVIESKDKTINLQLRQILQLEAIVRKPV